MYLCRISGKFRGKSILKRNLKDMTVLQAKQRRFITQDIYTLKLVVAPLARQICTFRMRAVTAGWRNRGRGVCVSGGSGPDVVDRPVMDGAERESTSLVK